MTLSDKIDIINGKGSLKNSKIKNYFIDVQIILAKMNKTKEYGKIKMLSLLAGIGGLAIAGILNNYLLALIFVPVLAILPFEAVKVKYRQYNKILAEELETALSLITISYTRTGSLVTSVKETIETLPPNAKVYFEEFLTEVTSINANVNSALVNLKTKIENRIFQQWVDRLIVCQSDRSAIPSLQKFVNEFADNRNIQNELDAEVYSARVELIVMICFVLFTPFLLYFVQKDAFMHLMNDFAGKVVIFISLVLCVIVYVIGKKIAKPIVFRGNKK